MSGTEAIEIIRRVVFEQREELENSTIAAREAEGWASPIVQAQSELQGYDDRVQYKTFAETLSDAIDYNQMPTGVGEIDWDDYENVECFSEDDYRADCYRIHLEEHLSSAGSVGTGAAVAWVGIDGYFTLIRETATAAEAEDAAAACFCE